MRSEIGIQWTRLLALALLGVAAWPGHAEADTLEKVEFDDATVEEVIGYFRTGGGSKDKTRNILVDPKVDTDTRLTLKLRDVSEGEAFAYVAELAGFDFREERHALRIIPAKGGKPSATGFLRRGGPLTWRRAKQMRLPKVEFEGTELRDVVSDLRAASQQLDPKKKGLNLVLGRGIDPSTPVTLNLQNVPISTVLNYVAELARLQVRADGPAIVLLPRGKAEE